MLQCALGFAKGCHCVHILLCCCSPNRLCLCHFCLAWRPPVTFAACKHLHCVMQGSSSSNLHEENAQQDKDEVCAHVSLQKAFVADLFAVHCGTGFGSGTGFGRGTCILMHCAPLTITVTGLKRLAHMFHIMQDCDEEGWDCTEDYMAEVLRAYYPTAEKPAPQLVRHNASCGYLWPVHGTQTAYRLLSPASLPSYLLCHIRLILHP